MANERVGGVDGHGAASVDWSFAASQAYLPPRSPIYTGIHDHSSSFFSNWPKLPHPGANPIPSRRRHQRTPSTSVISQAPAWVNDLLDETAEMAPVKSSHRRSSSDSLAFMDAPTEPSQAPASHTGEDGATNNTMSIGSAETNEFWTASEVVRAGSLLQHQNAHFPNAKFHSPVASERMRLPEASAAPSDQDSANASSMDDEKNWILNQVKNESEVESVLRSEATTTAAAAGKGEASCSLTTDGGALDPKRAKRILANRQSAQRSRVRKLQYISELEKTVNILQEEVSVLSPQVTYLDRHRIILNVDNSAMKQRLAALAQEKLFKDAHNEALKNEVHRLRQLYQHQQQTKHQQQHQQNLSCNVNQHLGSVPLSPQQEVRESEVGLNATRCVDYILDETKVDLIKDTVPPRSPLMKPIGPSTCSTGEKASKVMMHPQVMPGLPAHLHPDVRVQNP